MKNFWIPAVLMLFFFSSCSSQGSKLKGTWKVSNVETHFEVQNLPPNVIQHVKDEQKKISFRIVSDSVMVLMLDNNTHEAIWKMDPKTHVIKYYFSNQKDLINTLGTFKGNEIISESNTPLGKITVVFEKQ
ncbi:MAG: hypothetical protein JXR65_09980 [Bacteroidales bacterium]|nr:hypothetical protein [Bacteroidales bacterium]